MSVIVFDLGGTYLRAALFKESDHLQHYNKMLIPNFLSLQDPEKIWDEIIKMMTGYVRSIADHVQLSVPIVIAFPGPIDANQHILSAPTIVSDANVFPDIAQMLRESVQHPVYLINDVSAATWRFSEVINEDRFMVVTVSSGIGNKVFDRHNRKGVLDDVAYGGEIGHAKVDFSADAPPCDCGGYGHLAGISSGRGVERHIQKMARRQITQFEQSLCVTRFGATLDHLSNEEHIIPAAIAGDDWALQGIRDCMTPLAYALSLTTVALGIEKIVIIGGFALALGSTYTELLREQLRSITDYHLLSPQVDQLFQLGDIREDACLIGAGIYAQQQIIRR